MDRCQTPGYALDPLLPFVDRRLLIWEPACGEGYLTAALRESGRKVIGSDILYGQDFFLETPSHWDAMITNPPYSLKYAWLLRCYALGKPFALLLPVETLGAKAAQDRFRAHGVEVVFLSKRINFKMPNIGWKSSAAQFPVCWITWGFNIGQQLTFAEVKPRQVIDTLDFSDPLTAHLLGHD